MAFPTTGYNVTRLDATIRATDGTNEEILNFYMDNTANPNTQEAAIAAFRAAATVLETRHPGWTVYKTVRYTGTRDVIVDPA